MLEVKKLKLPELNDEFARTCDFEDVADLRQGVQLPGESAQLPTAASGSQASHRRADCRGQLGLPLIYCAAKAGGNWSEPSWNCNANGFGEEAEIGH